MRRVRWVPFLIALLLVMGLYGHAPERSLVLAEGPAQPAAPSGPALHAVSLPLIALRTSTATPNLYVIANDDCDNTYTVAWSAVPSASRYVLEEATDQAFQTTNVVYSGPGLSWVAASPGKLPGTYYYRVRAFHSLGESPYSAPRSVVIHPIYVGLAVRWDGSGYVRGSIYRDIGVHTRMVLDQLTAPDTVRLNGTGWYDPNPFGWDAEQWVSYYRASTGEFLSSPSAGDPSWKWGYSWLLPYGASFVDGATVSVSAVPFRVSGPHWGTTTYGQPIRFWQFVNTEAFTMWDDGADLTQRVLAGEAVLRYDADGSGLLLYSDVRRVFFYQGRATSDSVQYVETLTAATSLPGSPVVTFGATQDVLPAEGGADHPEGSGRTPNPAEAPLARWGTIIPEGATLEDAETG